MVSLPVSDKARPTGAATVADSSTEMAMVAERRRFSQMNIGICGLERFELF